MWRLMSVDINDTPRLAIIAGFSDTKVREELCCFNPMYDTTKEKTWLRRSSVILSRELTMKRYSQLQQTAHPLW